MPPDTDSDSVAERDSNQPGNPATVAMRVRDIKAVIQTLGEFRCDTAMMGKEIRVENTLGGASFTLHRDQLAVELSFSFNGFVVEDDGGDSDGAANDEPGLRVEGAFLVLYSLESGEDLSEPDLTAFAHINGPLNVVPYWREFVSSSLVRAGMPPYTVPVFNPAKIARDMAEEASALPDSKTDESEEN